LGTYPIFILGPKKFTRNSGCLYWPERRIPASANDLVGNVCAISRKAIEGHCALSGHAISDSSRVIPLLPWRLRNCAMMTALCRIVFDPKP
jgi:hypothetical protein